MSNLDDDERPLPLAVIGPTRQIVAACDEIARCRQLDFEQRDNFADISKYLRELLARQPQPKKAIPSLC